MLLFCYSMYKGTDMENSFIYGVTWAQLNTHFIPFLEIARLLYETPLFSIIFFFSQSKCPPFLPH